MWGYENQTDRNFKIYIADDGSDSRTQEIIRKIQRNGLLEIVHVWHEDKGFQKTKILNDVLRHCDCPYVIFTDHDCIPRRDFVAIHRRFARPGQFLSGGYFKLSMPVSQLIKKDDVITGRIFSYNWLRSKGQPMTIKSLKLTAGTFSRKIYEALSQTKATWNGMNSSAYIEDIKAVNGFNEQMQYGGLDREMGERMMNRGVVGRRIRYHAICVHLDHARGYATKETWEKNRRIRQRVKQQRLTWVDDGIDKPNHT